jgi:tRNA(fMet)-specific endonuclease VapC
MKYMLDTNICIYCIKKSPQKVFQHLQDQEIGDAGISAITYSELQFGVQNSSNPEQNQIALTEFVAPLEVADYEAEVGKAYGFIRSYLSKKGQPIGPLDLLIAAHAIHLEVVLVTNNVREFKKIPSLNVENWTI